MKQFHLEQIRRRPRLGAITSLLAVCALLIPSTASSFEALDGRFEAHGYYEMQVRTISKNFSGQWDLTQWYNVFNLELELDLVQESHGPLDLMSAFIRIEARFDCIYSRGCGMIRSADIYGNRAQNLPGRLNSGDEYTNANSIVIANDGPYADADRDPFKVQGVPGFRGIYEGTPEGLGDIRRTGLLRCGGPDGEGANANCPESQQNYKGGRLPSRFWDADRNLRTVGPDGQPANDGTDGAPYLIAMQKFQDFEFTAIAGKGGSNNGHPIILLGPWLPENYVEPNASLSSVANPLDSSRISPQSLSNGFGSNPMRPIPIYRENDPYAAQIFIYQETLPSGLDPEFQPAGRWQPINTPTGLFSDTRAWGDRSGRGTEARGIFMPTAPLRRGMEEGKFDSYPFNFSQTERAFNRGASQQDEGELKEAYLDIEMFDYRLWLRVGKQNIVWGKTELFRTTDQFNPQDYALATLPSLEESRIGLWSARGVWSFYDVGPFTDVRLELAVNFDDFEAADIGACGEPYAVNLVCQLTFGAWAHGFTGVGVAGVEQPPNPFNDAKGLEYGARIEWRWDRFSFAISDFYGYDDFPHIVRLSTYGRNVDWRSGRPRVLMDNVAFMADPNNGCAAPGYSESGEMITQGVVQRDGDGQITEYDFSRAPNSTGARVGYDSGDGLERSGCLTPGSTNREFRVQEYVNEDGVSEYYGVPYRVAWMPPKGNDFNTPVGNAGGYRKNNSLYTASGVFMNDTAYSDPNDPRRAYSAANLNAGDTLGLENWKQGPQAYLCDTPGSPLNSGGQVHPGCDEDRRGRRSWNTTKYVEWNGVDVPNPEYNPFYDPRFDRYFDPGALNDVAGDSWFLGQAFNGSQAEREQALLEQPSFSPGAVFATGDPVLFDPFELSGKANQWRSISIWQNAYDPDIAEFDPRNSLDQSPVNVGVFNWVCSVTVGFSALDSSACALTVFSSSKQPAGSTQSSSAPRISTLISAFIMGSEGFNGFLGQFPSDNILSKGPLLPYGMGLPLVHLHEDLGVNPSKATRALIGQGLDAFRTKDVRILAAYNALDPNIYTQPYIYSREQESFNCIGNLPVVGAAGGVQLCGGLELQNESPSAQLDQRFRVGTFLGRVLTPEQEALLGCGPYFGTSCDANGADLLWSEASALIQSFVGSDSIGISFNDLGIANLVSESFGSHLMDNGSAGSEYRKDSRVLDRNGNLIRITKGDFYKPETWVPDLGSKGYIENGALGNRNLVFPEAERLPCDINTARLVMADGSLNPNRDRTSARCWDLRDTYQAFAIQPGTAGFEILGLGGPKCTTADIGGPEDPTGGVLPGCRNKWATNLYRPLDSWDGMSRLHPNNPDAGFVGNNYYSQVLSYRASKTQEAIVIPEEGGDPVVIQIPVHAGFDPNTDINPRTDYRQWSKLGGTFSAFDSLAYEIPCGEGQGTEANPGDPNNPVNYDCYLNNPSGSSPMGNTLASVSLPTGWTAANPTPGWEVGSVRYNLAAESRASGLNWGDFDVVNSGCDIQGLSEEQQRNNPDCYVGGWRQTVDGDPDPLGLAKPGTTSAGDVVYTLRYPREVKAVGLGSSDNNAFVNYGERVEGGCTTGENWAYLQVTSGDRLMSSINCSEVYRGNPFANLLNRGGSGHIFTGESYASEIAGASANLEQVLVAFSEEFQDGLASVRGFFNPELYESRFIYDEEWMWNFECDGITKTAEECGGRLFVGKPAPANGYPINSHLWYPNNDTSLQGRFAYSAYGDVNRLVDTLETPTLENGGRIRQVAGLNLAGINNQAGPQTTGSAAPTPAQWERYRFERSTRVPNPLKDGDVNKLQRDPNLPNVLTVFRDQLLAECVSARVNYQDGMSEADVRALYENCGTVANGGADDWSVTEQTRRLGNSFGQGGMLESAIWDYAFTGSENDLMALIPYCENLSYTQRDTQDIQLENGVLQPFIWGGNRIDCTRGEEGEVLGRKRCTFVTPQYCGLVQALSGIAGQKRNILRAGGNMNFGRKTSQWQSGGEIFLSYEKRNVLGFSMDFAEDTFKSNWSVEFTWIEGVPRNDADSYNFTTKTDDFNLTISIDRPTFINFLNANRTFFMNTQIFLQYQKGWEDSFSGIGPWNALATFAVFTGYFQDRLTPQLIFVYDFRSRSGGALPQVNYRFSENFSITVGASLFSGSTRYVDMNVNTIGPAALRGGPNAYRDGTQPGLSVVRDRDEVFMVLRYTF